MSAHIALPAYAKTMGAEGVELYRPASISRFLNQNLLRDKLGFNGLIVSDASEMAGITSWCPPPQSKVDILSSGCDMLLMSSDPATEMAAVTEAVQTGAYPQAQMETSVLRVLALKASLGLHKELRSIPVDYATNSAFAKDIMTRAPTLVKDTQNLLPITLANHKRVQRIDTSQFDLVLYLMGEETLLTRGHIFLDWAKLGGTFIEAMQRTWHDVPTAMISFGYPYYLYGAPRMPTYINAYSTMDDMQRAVIELLLGRAQWQGRNPVDPFVGAPDAEF